MNRHKIHNILILLGFFSIIFLTSPAFAKNDNKQRILINVAAKELHLIEDGKIASTYKVAVGDTNFPTPLGTRLIPHIVWNPWWIPPKKSSEWALEYQDTPPGEDNPLGPVKMDIGDMYFIHGNNDPISIGHAVTHGCVRLLDEDAISLAKRLMDQSGSNAESEKVDEALSNKIENYRIALHAPVRVDIIYDLVEVKNQTIYVYPDVYELETGPITEKIVSKLVELGVPQNKIRAQLLRRDLKLAPKKAEHALSFSKYVKKIDPNQIASNAIMEQEL